MSRDLQYILFSSIFVLVFSLGLKANPSALPGDMENSVSILEKDPKKLAEYKQQSFDFFNGINSIGTKPLVLNREEYLLIAKDLNLILSSLEAFYQDHFSGRKTYLANNLIPSGLINYILQDYWYHDPSLSIEDKDRNYTQEEVPTARLKNVSPDRVQLFGGPDLVFTNDGVRILELNIAGNLGGLASVDESREFFVGFDSHYREALEKHYDKNEFIKSFSKYSLERAKKYKAKPAVVFPSSNYENSESLKVKRRLQKKLRDWGFIVLEMPYEDIVNPELSHSYSHTIQIKDKGVFVTDKASGEKNKVGYLIPFMSHFQFSQQPENEVFLHAFKSSYMDLALSPGAEIFSDKRFLEYTQALVKFYTGEELRVKPPFTKNFFDFKNHQLDSKFLMDVFSQPEKWVIKEANGSGGNSVWLGTDIRTNFALLEELSEKIKKHPETFLAQRSVDIDTRGDLRLFVASGSGTSYISPTGWSRRIIPNQKANTSGRYGEAEFNAVFVEKPKRSYCKKIFR